MDAVRFIEERNRMCENFNTVCIGCPAFNVCESGLCCVVDKKSTLDATAQIAIVEEWSRAHPRKTRQSVFLEQWPDAELDDDGVLYISPCSLSKKYENCDDSTKNCRDCCREFWMQEVE